MRIRDRDFFVATFAGGFFNHNSCSRVSRDSPVLGEMEGHLTPNITKEFRAQTSQLQNRCSLQVPGSRWTSVNGTPDVGTRWSCSWMCGLADRDLGPQDSLSRHGAQVALEHLRYGVKVSLSAAPPKSAPQEPCAAVIRCLRHHQLWITLGPTALQGPVGPRKVKGPWSGDPLRRCTR